MKLWQYRLSGIAAGLVVGSILVLGLTACDAQTDQRPTNPDGTFVRDKHPQRATVFNGGSTPLLEIMHDDDRSVTCWARKGYQESSLACLPDWMLTPVKRKPVTDECLAKDVGKSEACDRQLAVWPTGDLCLGNETCIAFDKRRRALAGDGVSL